MPLIRQLIMLFLCFLLLSKTTIDYQVVATFIVHDETTDAITDEVLNMLSDWNPNWKMNLVGNVFEDTLILFCDLLLIITYCSLNNFMTKCIPSTREIFYII